MRVGKHLPIEYRIYGLFFGVSASCRPEFSVPILPFLLIGNPALGLNDAEDETKVLPILPKPDYVIGFSLVRPFSPDELDAGDGHGSILHEWDRRDSNP